MCHKNQQSHPNPLVDIGLQDITAHVDFTHIAESAHAFFLINFLQASGRLAYAILFPL